MAPAPAPPSATRPARLPLSRIKALVKADPDVSLASQEAVFAIARAATMPLTQQTSLHFWKVRWTDWTKRNSWKEGARGAVQSKPEVQDETLSDGGVCFALLDLPCSKWH
ncbi:DNA polymerase epsilon subunit 4 isoform X2 [Varanus komodoensis]|uniref:DNA polymerase epsilon subunit 4 isoform X2 n=1 Tax=Varanus komodoensis TaxID=61221 RepID=UPI001CF772EA|nr:DNA polymerase epsilon subunit 4 isoform X2 [Varanus komodoensis]